MLATLGFMIAGLAGCGGGGSTGGEAAVANVSAMIAGSAAPVSSAVAGASPDAAPALAGNGLASEPPSATPPATITAGGSAPLETVRALGVSSSMSLAGVPESPPAAPSLRPAARGRSFYVDNAIGNDGNDGLAASTSGATGPWRTLARLMQSGLAAGDTVQLACGSVWRETLRLPASGTASQPIIVTAPTAGCSTPPSIDGSVALPPAAWTPYRGSIYKATLDSAPLQLSASNGPLTEAHHPNRGSVTGDASPPYLALAADGNTTSPDGQGGSNVLATGADLVLPAGASLGAGARVRVRTNSYVIDESPVAGFDGARLSLARATTYPVRAGWGYLLLGQLWMLDSSGEWYYDAASRQLYAWMPDSAPPAAGVQVSVLPLGIDLQGRSHVVVDGVAVRRVGLGVDLRRSTGVQLRNCLVEDVADVGVNAAASAGVVIESNSVSRTGSDAITGWGGATGELLPDAAGMTVRNNLVRDSGVLMQGEQVLSSPRRSLAAVFIGTNSVASGNTILNAGYIGILAGAGNVVEDNFVYGACSVQDDCAGIYTGGADNNSKIRRNTVVHSRGSLAGQPVAQRGTAAQGIYIDDDGAGITVEDNTVIDADYGILMHNATRNIIRGNRLYANRSGQIWMQEDANRHNANGDMTGNIVEDNQIAAVAPQAVGYLLSTRFASTAAFGTFDRNRFFDRTSATVAFISSAAGAHTYTLGNWRGATGAGSLQPVDTQATGTSLRGFANYRVSGDNLVGNSKLQADRAGWNTWNQTAPAGRAIREACPAGICLRYEVGGSPGVLSSPGFAVEEGRWYRISLDIATETDRQTVPLVVRVGGADYASVSDRNLFLVANRAWSRYSVVFQATRTVDPQLSSAGGISARVDIDGIEAGKSISLARLELVPITPDALAQASGAVVNAGAKPLSVACPFAASSPALCGKLFTLADDQPITWPLIVSPRNAVIFYAQEVTLFDTDHDGIPDAQDSCPGTETSASVNANGCAFSQR